MIGSATIDEADLASPAIEVYGGDLLFDGGQAGAVMDAYRELVADAPDELTASLALLRLPALSTVPQPLRGRFGVRVRVAYAGSAAQGQWLIAGLRATAPALLDTVGLMGRTALQADPVPVYERSVELTSFPMLAADTLLAVAGPDATPPVPMVEIRQLGGAFVAQPRTPNGAGHRATRFQLLARIPGEPGTKASAEPLLEAALQALAPWAAENTQVSV
ncbi:hypothetical protein FB565_000277 [Actinoplanes lutulentus]|uniref:Uncharacterized protein n=1 Tax=Actinoplanes lutulentus TaxID=1287878 RepID=A0A327ZKT1_9ACTN|nr:hypothetical protein [Actinoplanes lutulentus]MBB2940573.1 hypothetical protein [Actinoplanes lutulentus]RAK42885.1 hypothetical protein B0I29_10115 [Actinoplanes lutulentus]